MQVAFFKMDTSVTVVYLYITIRNKNAVRMFHARDVASACAPLNYHNLTLLKNKLNSMKDIVGPWRHICGGIDLWLVSPISSQLKQAWALLQAC